MDIEVTKELQAFIDKDNEYFSVLKANSTAFQEYFKNHYKYLVGKRVRVHGNKAWNVGTITELLPRIGHTNGILYLRLMIKGPDSKVLMFDMEEIVEVL